jgi:hypothetical protein
MGFRKLFNFADVIRATDIDIKALFAPEDAISGFYWLGHTLN